MRLRPFKPDPATPQELLWLREHAQRYRHNGLDLLALVNEMTGKGELEKLTGDEVRKVAVKMHEAEK